MTCVCYRGIEVSAKVQQVLLGDRARRCWRVFAVVALVRVAIGHAPPGHLTPSLSWFNPLDGSLAQLVDGLILMLFIYWGWDTSLSVNEETSDKDRLPGLRRHHRHGHAARHLRRRHPRGPVLRRSRHDGHRPRQPGARQRRPLRARHGRVRLVHRSARSSRTCCC